MKKTKISQILENNDQPVAKRTRVNKPLLMKADDKKDNYFKYISATEFENFCKGDKIVDWFSILSKSYILDEETPEEHPLSFLFEKGVEYEKNIIEDIRTITSLKLDKVSSLKTSREYNDPKNFLYDKQDRKKLMDAMKRGDPIIYSAYICDEKECLRGIPDLMIRSDYIKELFTDVVYEYDFEEEKNPYYIPVEIKFSTINLDASNSTILNVDRIKFYKTQLYTYCKILESIQGVFPKYAFIIGKKTKTKDGKSWNPIRKPGLVDFSSPRDEYVLEMFENGLHWLRDVKNNGINWKINPSLYPNMKIDNPLFQKDKKKIAEEIGEITDIWQCSLKNREKAFNSGIYSWKDSRLNSEVLGVSDKYKETVDLILKVNRGELGDFYPMKFSNENNLYNFRDDHTQDMYVDFETVHDTLNVDNEYSSQSDEWIFLIGVWHKGKYIKFLMNSLNEDEEKRVLSEFYQYWVDNNKPKCWNWFAEKEIWKRSIKRNGLEGNYEDIIWADLYEIFKKEQFVVKGCKNFKLKSYIKSLSSLGYIQADFPEACTNGLDAMFMAWNHYNNENNEDNQDNKNMENILKYNELDCIYLQKLLDFIKNL